MKVQRILPLLVVGLIGTGLQAEDLDIGLKLRGTMGMKSEAGVKHGLAVGLGAAIPMPVVKGAKLNVELGYRYYTGDGNRQHVAANALTDPQYDVNFQKLNVEGWYGRCTFGMPITESLGWHAGVEIDALKSRMDAIGDFYDVDGNQVGSWAFNPEKKGITASPLAGITYQFNTAGALELNLMLATYKQVTVTPVFGATSVTPLVGSKNVSTLKIELGYSFRF